MHFLRYIVFFFSFLICTNCLAQKQKIDSLKRALSGLKDSARIDCLNEISSSYIYNEATNAKMFAQEALKEGEKINYKKGMAVAWLNMAWANGLSGGDIITMENYCRNAISLLDDPGHRKQLVDAWFSLGCTLSEQCKFSSSIDAFDIAGKLFLQTGDELGLARMYGYMGDVERNRGQYSKSLEYAVKWLDIANKYKDNSYIDVWASLYMVVGDYVTALDYYTQAAEMEKMAKKIDDELVFCTRMKGEIFLLQEQYDSARFYFDLAIQYNPQPQRPPLNTQWGPFYLAIKKYDSALLYLNNGLTHAKKINDIVAVQLFLLNVCKAHKETGNTQLAMQYAKEFLQISEQTGARQHIRDGHFMLYQLFAQSGERDSAFNHLQKYTTLKDTIDKDLSAQNLAFYKIKSEKEKDQARIDVLNEEKKLQQQQLKQTAQQRKFLIIGIAGILLLGIFLLRNLILKRKNEANRRAIVENELQLQKLESQKARVELQHQAAELEMQALRSQMNPHFIFNSLNSINLFILENNKLQASEYLSKFSRLIRLILQNSKEAFIPLESELEALQLYLELESLRFEDKFEYKIIVDDDVDASVLKVPPLIIQPYAENAVWHGLMHLRNGRTDKDERGHLAIELYREEQILLCKITDNGIGRKKAAELKSKSAFVNKSLGMKITKSRLAMLKKMAGNDMLVEIKDLVYADGSAAGTEVLIKIPLL